MRIQGRAKVAEIGAQGVGCRSFPPPSGRGAAISRAGCRGWRGSDGPARCPRAAGTGGLGGQRHVREAMATASDPDSAVGSVARACFGPSPRRPPPFWRCGCPGQRRQGRCRVRFWPQSGAWEVDRVASDPLREAMEAASDPDSAVGSVARACFGPSPCLPPPVSAVWRRPPACQGRSRARFRPQSGAWDATTAAQPGRKRVGRGSGRGAGRRQLPGARSPGGRAWVGGQGWVGEKMPPPGLLRRRSSTAHIHAHY